MSQSECRSEARIHVSSHYSPRLQRAVTCSAPLDLIGWNGPFRLRSLPSCGVKRRAFTQEEGGTWKGERGDGLKRDHNNALEPNELDRASVRARRNGEKYRVEKKIRNRQRRSKGTAVKRGLYNDELVVAAVVSTTIASALSLEAPLSSGAKMGLPPLYALSKSLNIRSLFYSRILY